MQIIFFLILIVIFSNFINWVEQKALERQAKVLSEIKEEVYPTEKKCPPHKWSHHPETHKLTCTSCNYVAGTEVPSSDSPY